MRNFTLFPFSKTKKFNLKKFLIVLALNFVYEDHSDIIDTPFAFWTLEEMKNSAHNKLKRKDWTGWEREKVGQLCPSTDRGGSGRGYGRQLAPTALI